MLPALPVTSSTRPSIHWRMSSMSKLTGSRRSRSSIETGRGWTVDGALDQLLVAGQDADFAAAALGVVHQCAHLRAGKFACMTRICRDRRSDKLSGVCSQSPSTGTPSMPRSHESGAVVDEADDPVARAGRCGESSAAWTRPCRRRRRSAPAPRSARGEQRPSRSRANPAPASGPRRARRWSFPNRAGTRCGESPAAGQQDTGSSPSSPSRPSRPAASTTRS